MANKGVKKIFVTPLTDIGVSDKEGLGVLRHDGERTYKYVKYNSGTGPVAAVAGNFAVYHGDNGVDDVEVTSDYSDGNGVGAGLLLAALGNGNFGWIQISGPAVLTPALTAGADGNALTAVGAGDGTLDVAALVSDHICAIAVDASAKKVLLNCPQ